MKGKRFCHLACLITVLLVFSNANIMAQNLLIAEVTNLRNNKGQVVMELFDEDHNSLKVITGVIDVNKCTIKYEDLKDGIYAIRYFHDENSDMDIETNVVGIPKEGIGIVNNAIGQFGPKPFKQWLFTVRGDTLITLATYYY